MSIRRTPEHAPGGDPRSARLQRRRLLLAAPLTVPLGAAGVLAHPPARAADPSRASTGTLAPTPRQSRGPFYPLELPRDTGADLIIERDGRRARGEMVRLSGRILDTRGRPLPDALVEIWQCNADGRYHHPYDRNPAPVDPLFRAYGRVRTGADGRYAFRTVRPVPYPGRTPHVHFQVAAPGRPTLVTQMYVRDEPANDRDGLLAGLRPDERDRLEADFVRSGDGWAVGFDLILA